MSITLIWTIVLVVSVIVEAITVDLVSIWFGLGALAALIGEACGLSQVLQVVIFTIISVVILLKQIWIELLVNIA